MHEAGFEALLDAAEHGDAQASRQLLGVLTTKFTGFFRHPKHFEAAAAHGLRAVRQRGVARFWSAAAATGEEPYSFAMALLQAFPRETPPVSILASDLDEDALAVARRGEYSDGELQIIDPEQRTEYFRPASAGRWTLTPAVRRLLEFRVINLAVLDWPVEGPFDVILCRNVLMYLASSLRYAVLERMAFLLAPDGLLILDPTEHLGRAAHLFGPEVGGVYSRGSAAVPRAMHV
jgi:chemotaxis protein methyltransferase CheR